MVNSLSGFELSDPKVFAVRLHLEGVAPLVIRTSNITIIRIEEIDELGQVVEGSTFNYVTFVVNTTESTTLFSNKLSILEKKLEIFRSHLDEKSAIGVNTTMSEGKYNQARSLLDFKCCNSGGGYFEQINQLKIADESLDEGERLLDKAWAEKSVADTQIPLGQADQIISWYKGNMSTANDKKLPAIITKRDQAAATLSAANDEIANGDYAQARSKAAEAYQVANESFNEALTRKNSLSVCWGCSPFISITQFVIPGAGIGAIVLVIIGIIWWKRR